MRMKDVVSLSDERTEDKTLPYIALENIESWTSNFIPTEAETVGLNSKFCRGDVLFGKLRPYLAKGYITQYDGICSTEFFVMHPHKSVRSKYLLYWELSHNVIDFLKNQVAGVKMPRTTWYDFSNQQIYLPSLPEQDRIVAYLDEKTAAIDSQVSLLEQKAKKYEQLKKSLISHAVTRGLDKDVRLKESGIDWIGQIPEHWETGRIKEHIKAIESGKRPANEAEEVLSIGGEHIQSGKFYLEHDMYVSNSTYENSYGKIAIGDILVVKDGATIGKCMYVDNMPNERMLLNEHVYRIVASKYFFYYIMSPLGQYWFRSRNMSSAQESIKQTTMFNLPVPLPPLSEQQAIADYLDKKTAEIDAAIANINQQIEKYKLLRRALINEVVTGQRAI